MSSQFDESDFVDSDYQTAQQAGLASTPPAAAPALPSRPPSREEIDAKVNVAQQKLSELKRAQEELERERAALEESRRRQMEFYTGREEILRHLTRGLGLLQEAELAARRDAEQMAKTLTNLRGALERVEAINEEAWTNETWSTELTRGLTAIENARLEWNTARIKWPVLNNPVTLEEGASAGAEGSALPVLGNLSFTQLCRLGFALTWPLALLGLGIFLLLLLRK